MATIQSGILSKTRGKVAGVVGSTWKGKNFVREYVKPTDPQTPAQMAQRERLKAATAFIKPAILPILHPYVEPFIKGDSAFNYWIKQNVMKDLVNPRQSTIVLTKGVIDPFYESPPVSITTASAVIAILPSNMGKFTIGDNIEVAIRRRSTGQWWFLKPRATPQPNTTAVFDFRGNQLVRGEQVDVWFVVSRRIKGKVAATNTAVNIVVRVQ